MGEGGGRVPFGSKDRGLNFLMLKVFRVALSPMTSGGTS